MKKTTQKPTYKQSVFINKFHLPSKLQFIIAILLILPLKIFANEEAAPAAEEHGAPKEEGSKEGGGAFIKKDEFLELNAAVEQLNAKLRAKKDTLMKLLLDKDNVKDPIEFKKIVKQIETEYREMGEISENIDKKKAILRYRFPERSFVKNAEKSKVQQIEEIGSEALIEKQMNQLLNLVESQYQQSVRPKEMREQQLRGPANTEGEHEGTKLQQNPEDFSKSLILKK